ncbi:hypothetical protein QF017_005049 [Pseudomonas laurylsulfatiphila]|jgi:hypothetical protein|uniref:hypothetical protein n=1 Tax=Pseudomonas laurylsulfatiphila TaxID=2011015 RepID=UPI003D1B0372
MLLVIARHIGSLRALSFDVWSVKAAANDGQFVCTCVVSALQYRNNFVVAQVSDSEEEHHLVYIVGGKLT